MESSPTNEYKYESKSNEDKQLLLYLVCCFSEPASWLPNLSHTKKSHANTSCDSEPSVSNAYR